MTPHTYDLCTGAKMYATKKKITGTLHPLYKFVHTRT